jgi:hypothetical protein
VSRETEARGVGGAAARKQKKRAGLAGQPRANKNSKRFFFEKKNQKTFIRIA